MQTENGLTFLSRVGIKPVNDLGKELFQHALIPPEVIEVCGMPSVGKSLLCLDLMASALLPKSLFNISMGGLETGVIFIDCDQHFNILHFVDLIERKMKRICHSKRSAWKSLGSEKANEELMTISKKNYNARIEIAIKECLKNLYYFNCTNSNQLAVTLLSIEQCLVNKSNVSLVIVDSISSFYWYDRIYKVDSWFKMELHLNHILRKFIDVIKRNYLVCICTKQNLFKTHKDTQTRNLYLESSKGAEPSSYEFMGKEWNSNVTVKINMKLSFNNKDQSSSGISDESVHCIIESIQGDVSKILNCTFHEDGIRWHQQTTSLLQNSSASN